jgi:hypothetical protein
MDNPLEFALADNMKLHAISEKFSIEYVTNLKWKAST